MDEPCLFEILDHSEDSLRRALPKASARSLVRLVAAYPRAAGKTLLEMVSQCMSKPTLHFFKEELNASPLPTYDQIRSAERELMKLIQEEDAATVPDTALSKSRLP